ncbi:MAG: ribonucleotide-diphosphate reductase subunit alpha, partial [Deltaproteobacteria bacterium]
PHIGKIESTNPCGEQPILPYESCNLGSINLNTILKDGEIDWEKLSKITKTAVHFLDNVIDANAYPIPQIEAITKANRKIGLGVMGLADLFAKKKIRYDSQAALDLADKLMSFIQKTAMEASEELASKRGAFPNFKGSIYDKAGQKPLRNATVTTIAPTGTLSLIAGCSSGIEPIFARSYIKEVLEGEKLPEVHPEGIPTAHEISAEWHVRMQAVFQKYSDSAVSKTVNLAHDATTEDIRKAYLLAYELGCKGITVFRDRSKETQVLNIPPKDSDTRVSDLICPECKTLFKHEEACTYCPSCGYMRCY